ncbi:MAG TPA: serine/threonine-protein kinase [Pirellulaceae bacterium]|nr:serine/threonine-protein kinase [Pirellulaceae bacterium]
MNEEQLFHDFVACPPEMLARLLEERFPDDAGLRQRLRRLVEAHRQPMSLWEDRTRTETEVAFAPNLQGDGLPDASIGPYRLLKKLGEGGMGIVYLAEQTVPVRRRVALKLIRPGLNFGHVVARFEAERQALALMDHPNIARILDAGTTAAGVPFFVMELVDGDPITEFCDRERLTVRERLGLLRSTCQAVQHAHRKGVIHRDLKPSNILVAQSESGPIVKVIDFGVAKALEGSLSSMTIHTGAHQLLGTPLYMSPEQLEPGNIDIDTRSDVFSLGVLLYELLTGTTPVERELAKRGGLIEFRQVIENEESRRPSRRVTTLAEVAAATIAESRRLDRRSLASLCRGELDWITMKALEFDRNRRYESATALAEDLSRYLNHDAVLASPPSLRYRTAKFVRRNVLAISVAAVSGTSLIVGTAVSLWQADRAWRAQEEAMDSQRLAARVVDDMYTKFAEQWIAEDGVADARQREVLEKALAFYRSQAVGDVSVAAIGRASLRVAAVQSKLGEHLEAEEALRNLIRFLSQARDGQEDPESVGLEIRARLQLGNQLLKQGARDASRTELIAATDLIRSSTSWPELDIESRRKLAGVISNASIDLCDLDERALADDFLRHSLTIWDQLLIEDPTSFDNRLGHAQAASDQAYLLLRSGRSTDARTASIELIDRFSALLSERPRHRELRISLATCHHRLSYLAGRRNDLEESLAQGYDALELSDELTQDYPTDQRSLSLMLNVLGNIQQSQSDLGRQEELERTNDARYSLALRLTRLYPDVERYLEVLLQAASQELASARREQDESTRLEIGRTLVERSRHAVETEPRSSGLRRIRSDVELLFVAELLELGKVAEAGEILRTWASDPEDDKLHPRLVEDPTNHPEPFVIAVTCNHELTRLLRPAITIDEYLRVASVAGQADDTDRSESHERLEAIASRCRSAAQQVIGVWEATVRRLDVDADMFPLYDFLVSGNDTIYLSVHLRLARETDGRMTRDLFRRLLEYEQLPPNGQVSRSIGELVAGPETSRDGKLALELANLQIGMRPQDGMARQDLGWAHFRNGDYQKAFDILSEISKVGDPDNGAILAICLWHLGRQDEALDWIGEEYARRRDEMVEVRRKALGERRVLWPTHKSLLRLDREARSLFDAGSGQ